MEEVPQKPSSASSKSNHFQIPFGSVSFGNKKTFLTSFCYRSCCLSAQQRNFIFQVQIDILKLLLLIYLKIFVKRLRKVVIILQHTWMVSVNWKAFSVSAENSMYRLFSLKYKIDFRRKFCFETLSYTCCPSRADGRKFRHSLHLTLKHAKIKVK